MYSVRGEEQAWNWVFPSILATQSRPPEPNVSVENSSLGARLLWAFRSPFCRLTHYFKVISGGFSFKNCATCPFWGFWFGACQWISVTHVSVCHEYVKLVDEKIINRQTSIYLAKIVDPIHMLDKSWWRAALKKLKSSGKHNGDYAWQRLFAVIILQSPFSQQFSAIDGLWTSRRAHLSFWATLAKLDHQNSKSNSMN